MFDYDEESRLAVEVLDKYDFTSVLKNCYGIDIYDIEELLESFGEEVSKAVSDLTTEEFAEYLHLRYDMRIEEVSRYCIWWNSRHEMEEATNG